MPYKTDKKFNRNTLKLNSLSLKVLNVHFFLPRNIKPSNTKQTNKKKTSDYKRPPPPHMGISPIKSFPLNSIYDNILKHRKM